METQACPSQDKKAKTGGKEMETVEDGHGLSRRPHLLRPHPLRPHILRPHVLRPHLLRPHLLLILSLILAFSIHCPRQQLVLYLFTWSDYIDPGLIKKFEREHSCKVVYDMYGTNEEMLTRIQITGAKYDLVVSSGDYVEIMSRKTLLHVLTKSKLKNYDHLDAAILQMARNFDPENAHAVPYFWGTCGFIYNKRYLNDEDMRAVSWDIISDPFFTGRKAISMLDDAREVVGAALIYSGYSPNTVDDQALARAREALLRWDKNISHYDSDAYKNEIQDGTIWLGQSYNGDALQIMIMNPDIGFTLPREGTTLWIDSLVIPGNAEHKELAHRFIDFLLDTENALQNALYVCYATPVKTARERLPDEIKNNPHIYPAGSYINRSFFIKDIGDGILKIDKVWQEIRYF